MTSDTTASFTTPRDSDLGCRQIANRMGLSASVLPNGSLFAIEHESERRRIMLNQVLGSPVHGGIGRLYLRIGGEQPRHGRDRRPRGQDPLWRRCGSLRLGRRDGAASRHRVDPVARTRQQCLALACRDHQSGPRPRSHAMCFSSRTSASAIAASVPNNEAYVSQYIDHHVAARTRLWSGDHEPAESRARRSLAVGHARMPRWRRRFCHRCDAALRSALSRSRQDRFIRSARTCRAKGCSMRSLAPRIQSRPRTVAPGASASWTFFGLHEPDHAEASSDADLAELDAVRAAHAGFAPNDIAVARAGAQHRAGRAAARGRSDERGRDRATAIRSGCMRSAKTERCSRSSCPMVLTTAMSCLPPRSASSPAATGRCCAAGRACCSTRRRSAQPCWMHGVFGAQLTIGNTSFHKLFSVSRDPYNITRASGLRILVDLGEGWRLLAVPSAFEMGLSDCRWIYRVGARTITVACGCVGR